jgi:sugar lactone lactonase YvrE
MFSRVRVFTVIATTLLLIIGLSAAAQTIAPVLVPYTITAIAGNTQSSVAGYGGENVPGLSATLSAPNALAVDSAGNVYIADLSNALIREWNPRTNNIQTIAGVPPTKCTGTACTIINSGCSDGVAAYGNRVGSRIQGMVVDGFGNVYFSDYNYQGVWVIYRGGDQVANFIALVDSGTVSSASAVQPGYIYHIAGTATPTSSGCSPSQSTPKANEDQVIATSAKFHDPLQMGIDAAGNLYVQDYANYVVRVINTQATTQTFFGVTVKPGYIAAVIGCNATWTKACTSTSLPWGSSTTLVSYNGLAGMTTDQYGNVYQINTKGTNGSIYAGVAYAGGSALANLLSLEKETAVAGGWYEVINSVSSTYATGYLNGNSSSGTVALEPAVPADFANDIVLRPSSIAVDPLGNIYMMDYHWQTTYRVDVNSKMAMRILPGLLNSSQVAPAGTNASPATCPSPAGATTSDAYGDGCSVQHAKVNNGGTGYITFDSAGNLYMSDTGNNIVRKISLGTQFATTTVGSTLTQTLQMHFDQSNLPTANNATAFKILGAAADFTISSVSCANYTIRDSSIECYVAVAFKPQAVGTRTATLQATAASGTYTFALNGVGGGPQIAIDGGAPATLQVTGLGAVTNVAIDTQGNIYAADPTNNVITVTPAGGGKTATIGSGFLSPKGVAVDAAGNVYVADTGNDRVVKIAAVTGTETVLSSDLNSGTGLNAPQGIAVDATGNVYVADTGNKRIVEISPFGELEPVPMLDYNGAQTFVSPVGIALDTAGNIYVADSGNGNGIIKIAASGGDLQVPSGNSAVPSPASLIRAALSEPTGVAVDAAGNLYVSDAGLNTVQEQPSGAGPLSSAVTLGFTGLSSPGGLALDASGNVYVADTGNTRIEYVNRTQVPVNFGTVAIGQPTSTVVLDVTNIGTSSLSPTSPFATLTGATADYSETDTCSVSNFSLGTLGSGLHCTLTVGLAPVVATALSASVSVQGGAANLSLSGMGEVPMPTLSLAMTSPASGPAKYTPAVITLTGTQPISPYPPSGTVTFNYTINGVAQTPVTANLTTSGSISTTTLTLANLLPARTYVITANYNGDPYNSPTSTTYTFTVPGVANLTVVSSNASFTYGGTVPTLTGTVTGILPADQAGITVTFKTSATPSSPVGTYPITAVLSGGNAVNYLVPAAVTSTGAPALVTEKPAPLSIVVGNYTNYYGYTDVVPSPVATGLVNGDQPTYTYTPADSNVLPVGTYTIVPTPSINISGTYDKINNYTVNITDGTLVVTKATPAISISQAATAVLPTNLSGATVTVIVSPQQACNGDTCYGSPSGTLTMIDAFTPITSTGTGATVTNTATLTLTPTLVKTISKVNPVGIATYTPTDSSIGTHVYTFNYNGDSNFTVANSTASLIVDEPDYTVTSTTTPILIVPGITPGGNASVANEEAAAPEQATISIAPILGSTATVNLTCTVPESYITCTLSPTSVTLTGKTTLTSTVSISTPSTLPINYTSSNAKSTRGAVLALLPAGLLTLIPLFRRRRKLWKMLLIVTAFTPLIVSSGCGGNQVKFYTPVPAGPTTVVVTGTNGSVSRSFTISINIQ